MIISLIRVHKVYYETRALFLSTKLRMQDKDKHEQVNVIIFYISDIDSSKVLFDTTETKMGHIQAGNAKVPFTYVHVAAQEIAQ